MTKHAAAQISSKNTFWPDAVNHFSANDHRASDHSIYFL